MVKSVTYSVEEDIIKAFNTVCEEESINRSKWIQKQMELFVKNKREQEEKKN